MLDDNYRKSDSSGVTGPVGVQRTFCRANDLFYRNTPLPRVHLSPSPCPVEQRAAPHEQMRVYRIAQGYLISAEADTREGYSVFFHELLSLCGGISSVV